MSDKLGKSNETSLLFSRFTSEEKDILKKLAAIKRKYNLTAVQFADILDIQKEELIPLSIFTSDLPPLESLTLFLKDNLCFNFHKIGEILNRNEKTIWTTYNNASKKGIKPPLTDSKYIPVSIFYSRKLSILESICRYLSQQDLKLTKIANMLNKDRRVIWTVLDRAKKKIGGGKKRK